MVKKRLKNSFSTSGKEIDRILNSTHDGMLAVDHNGIVTVFNDAAERITDISKDSVSGKYAKDVIPNTRLPIILNTGVPEYDRRQELNEYTTIITNRVPVYDEYGNIQGAVAVFRDITEIITLAEEVTDLKEIESMLKAIINSTQDAISVVDENGIGILINPAYTEITGLTKNDVIGKPATVDIAEGESMHYKVLKTKKAVKNVPLKVGPNKKDVLVDVAPIIVNGNLKGSVGVIHDVSKIKQLTEELNEAKSIIRKLEAKYTFDDIVGESGDIKAAIRIAKTAAQTPATVLLRGESGTGKELFAHAIHNNSERRYDPFVRVNCASLTETLLESELFGYVEGAFTGAKRGGKRGLFEEAKSGTIFLDEIGEMSLNLQAKLLRVLQEREVMRVGSNKPVPIKCRVIAATNRDLENAINNNEFRRDLYYRLNVIPIKIPSLGERAEDIPFLAQFLLKKFNQEYGRNVNEISDKALEILKKYDWPGNVRELENYIGRAMINMEITETIMKPNHLPSTEQTTKINCNNSTPNGREFTKDLSLDEIIQETEKKAIIEALERNNGKRSEAAKDLNIALRTLYYKIDKYKIS
ncbi:sigma-54 interaction domain-containing protein [Natranaerobius trueperi]|uniref:Sigma-54-dependent Fis family transcriptional regulator n=1 Tax=Natranaerobius trueperi TaxID=759412 RepID=A0A226BYB1_9FIRM|nr:sigma-54-dependent Fis family transcriptional regulator [Natranaerobius trueperi]OWZ84003.1 sigma-54-dependent Fis family transcriptional regulator [Natranaerobius trueperi]